jgi:uncharacterized protein (TIGR03067 family)
MKRFRNGMTLACVFIPSLVKPGEPLTANGKSPAIQPVAVELQPLQGTWEGVMVGQEKDGIITITITGNSLHFHRGTNFWFETTIALPAGKDPKQLHATIKACPRSQADSIGKVVRAFFKIENATLTMAMMGDDADETSKGFQAAGTRYELRKVQPEMKTTQPPKTK